MIHTVHSVYTVLLSKDSLVVQLSSFVNKTNCNLFVNTFRDRRPVSRITLLFWCISTRHPFCHENLSDHQVHRLNCPTCCCATMVIFTAFRQQIASLVPHHALCNQPPAKRTLPEILLQITLCLLNPPGSRKNPLLSAFHCTVTLLINTHKYKKLQ